MHSLRSIYQSLVLVALYHHGLCQNYRYQISARSVTVENNNRTFKNAVLSKDQTTGYIDFHENDELDQACGRFKASQVEITGVFGDQINFSITRPRLNNAVHLKCTFSFPSYVQTFFNDIRSQQRKDCGRRTDVKSMYKFPKSGNGTMTPLRDVNKFFVKSLNSDWFLNPKSFNFVDDSQGEDEPKLVFKALTYNIPHKIADDKYVMCVRDFPDYYFVVSFPDGSTGKKFYDSTRKTRDTRLICSIDWLTPEIVRTIV